MLTFHNVYGHLAMKIVFKIQRKTLLIFNQSEKYFSQSFSLICYSLSEPELEIDVFRYNKDFMEQSEVLSIHNLSST